MTAPRNRPRLPSSFTSRARNTRRNYVEGVRNGSIPMPEKGTPEARSLARLASLARWGRGPKATKLCSATFGTRKINVTPGYIYMYPCGGHKCPLTWKECPPIDA